MLAQWRPTKKYSARSAQSVQDQERSAEWPSSFYFYDRAENSMVCWAVRAIEWALSEGCTWGDWKCDQLEPELYTQLDYKRNTVAVFAWAHENGCPCTCNRGSGSSGSNENN